MESGAESPADSELARLAGLGSLEALNRAVNESDGSTREEANAGVAHDVVSPGTIGPRGLLGIEVLRRRWEVVEGSDRGVEVEVEVLVGVVELHGGGVQIVNVGGGFG